MSGKICFRFGSKKDATELDALLPQGAAKPKWEEVIVLEIDGKIRGFAGVRHVWMVEPLGADGGLSASLLVSWLLGQLHGQPLEFAVMKNNTRFIKWINRHLHVKQLTDYPETIRFERRK